MTTNSRYKVAFYRRRALNEHGRPIATIKITIISRNDHVVCGARTVFLSAVGGTNSDREIVSPSNHMIIGLG